MAPRCGLWAAMRSAALVNGCPIRNFGINDFSLTNNKYQFKYSFVKK
jgi:hypothetical protein